MARRFLENQLNRSLKNLGASCIDVYYLHNPETQLGEILRPDFLNRVRQAFEFLESAVAAGEIKIYGIASSRRLQQGCYASDFPFLRELAKINRALSGDTHHLPFLQLSYILAI